MQDEYNGHWIETYSGKKFHYLEPKADEIDIVDIAHALSLTCRFGGHCKMLYSVADHSVRVAELCKPYSKLSALLHDAHEAYVPDIPSSIKADLPDVRELNFTIEEAIMSKFTDFLGDWDEIRYMDEVMLASEARDLMPNVKDWRELPPPIEHTIVPRTAGRSESAFLKAFYKYAVAEHG